MAEREFEKLTDHEYDGIREYDNPCPAWWHLIFFGTFVFSVIYFVFVHLGTSNWTVNETYNTALAENLKLRFAEIGELTPDEPTLVRYMGESDWLAIGMSVYQRQCKSCHGAKGEGLVGPNLTDNTYKNVKTLVDVARVVEEGAAAGSMPAWKNRLHPNETVLVAAYVASLRGRNISGPRDDIEKNDGNYREIPPWPTLSDVQPASDDAEPEGAPGAESEADDAEPSSTSDEKS